MKIAVDAMGGDFAPHNIVAGVAEALRSGDKISRFGSGESEIRINKPVVLKAAFPRFMTRGDRAYFGSVVTSQLKQPGTAIVTATSDNGTTASTTVRVVVK